MSITTFLIAYAVVGWLYIVISLVQKTSVCIGYLLQFQDIYIKTVKLHIQKSKNECSGLP